MAAPGALAGTTVLDFSTVGPAARCTRILADYGARVIKVGAPRGVQIEPPWYAYAAGRGTLRLRIDLKAPGGRDALLRLARRADVLVESFRPGVAARLGIGYDDLCRVNPRLVYCSTSGYGQKGPRAGWAGHDLDYLAVSGFLHTGGRRADAGPALPGATLADAAGGGMHAAIAVLAALLRRGRSGRGEYLDVAVADGLLSLMALPVEQYLATGEEPGPGGDLLSGRYACYDVYPARDGRWLAVAAIEPAFFANLCRALGCPEWIPHQHDDARQDEIRAAFRRAFASRDRDAWVAELAGADTCVAPVQTIAEVARDPQFAERGAFGEAHHASRGRFRQLQPLLAGQPQGGEAVQVNEVDEASRSHTALLLREAGLEPDEIEALAREGVVA